MDVEFHKKYKSIYQSVTTSAKYLYNDNLCICTINKSKALWNIINTNIRTNKSYQTIDEIYYEDDSITGPVDIANVFNDYYTNVTITSPNFVAEILIAVPLHTINLLHRLWVPVSELVFYINIVSESEVIPAIM